MKAFAVALLTTIGLAWTSPALAADFNVPPAPTQHVTDNAAMLNDETRTAIENELKSYEKATGHQIVVWIGDTTGDVPLETWTVETANKWKIGRKGRDDGAILFIFAKDHKVRIEVGYGLESALTDADSYRIINHDIVPRMKENDPNGAVSAGVAAMLATISPSYKTSLPSPSPESEGTPIGSGVAIAIIVIVCLVFAFMIFVTIMQVVGMIRYGYLVLREGSTKAKSDMRHFWFWGTGGFLGGVASSAFSGGGGDDFGGGFSGGGGSFGGGGASGGW